MGNNCSSCATIITNSSKAEDINPNLQTEVFKFVVMLGRKPFFEEFVADENQQMILRCWNNDVFGGPVLLPVGANQSKRTKNNYLKTLMLRELSIPSNGGYFIAREVVADDTESRNCMYDVYILYLPEDEQDESGLIQFASEDQLLFSELKDHITGFARIIGYRMTSKGKKINFLEEGQYYKGYRNGYARNMSAVDGQVELGFYEEDLLRGKACIY